MNKYTSLIENAKRILPSLEPMVDSTPYEKKGILYSEFLFMSACLYGTKINRILESGRARGQSTLLLAKAFPDTEIVSIEFDENSPDVSVASERLKNYKNVKLLFGDSMSVIPQMLEKDEVIIIDGPKGFLAVRLALRLLSSKKVSHVFIHDVPLHDPCRNFLTAFLPEAVYSDHKELATVTHVLDKNIIEYISRANQIDGFEGEYGYGYTLGCIPYSEKRSDRLLHYLSFPYDLLNSGTSIWFRFNRKMKKYFGKTSV